MGLLQTYILLLWRFPKASLGSQDWAQITFREEINSNGLKNESVKWSAKRANPRSGNLSFIYRVFSTPYS